MADDADRLPGDRFLEFLDERIKVPRRRVTRRDPRDEVVEPPTNGFRGRSLSRPNRRQPARCQFLQRGR